MAFPDKYRQNKTLPLVKIKHRDIRQFVNTEHPVDKGHGDGEKTVSYTPNERNGMGRSCEFPVGRNFGKVEAEGFAAGVGMYDGKSGSG